jgi:hypothetical protein
MHQKQVLIGSFQSNLFFLLPSSKFWRHDIQHNDIQHEIYQHNDIQYDVIQHNDIQHNDTP